MIEVIGGKHIGGNKILFNKFFLDFGLDFTEWQKYFEVYLQPRASTGIYDYVKTGILPSLRIYREDLDYGILQSLQPIDVRAVILSHYHADHSGLIPFLHLSIPVISTKDTFEALKRLQALKQANGIMSQFIDMSLKEMKQNSVGTTVLASTKSSVQREFILLEYEKDLQFGDSIITFYPSAHTVGSAFTYIQSNNERVLYTGDINFHGYDNALAWDSVTKIAKRGVDLLITEGTNSQERSFLREEDLVDRFVDKFRRDSLIFIDITSRNVERIRTLCTASKLSNRSLVVTGEMYYFVKDFIPSFVKDIYVLEEKRVMIPSWFEELKDAKFISPEVIKEDPKSFVFVINFYDILNLLDLPTKNALYLFSRSEPFSEEQSISYDRLENWIRLNNMIFEHEDLHASSHAYLPEIKNMVSILRSYNPHMKVIVVHSEEPEKVAQYLEEEIERDR